MREILFRGKRLTTGEWTYGYLLADTADCKMKKRGECVCPHDGSVAYILTWVDEFHEYGYVEVDPATVGQYTGLKDKNGKRIFEGDWVVSTNEYRLSNRAYRVKFCPLSGYWMCNSKRKPLIVSDIIHDDPALLKGEDWP